MKKKVAIKFLIIAMILILSIGYFYNPSQLANLPDLNVYSGELYFSGEAAFNHLETFLKEFPSREIGQKNAELSSVWIENKFKDFGLETSVDRFKCTVPKRSIFGSKFDLIDNKVSLFRDSLNSISEKVDGINVMGISRGQTDEVILIGAHRDMLGSDQGAEDNGSGTVTMLELSKVLTKESHYFTYAFVSFDGEEALYKGSMDFVKRHRNLNIKSAVILDMTGYNEADTVWLYNPFTSTGVTPLWSLALTNSVIKSENLPNIYFAEENTNTFGIFINHIKKIAFGTVNTDTGPFLENGIPSIGIKAVSSKKYTEGQSHNPKDTIEQISPQTLQMAGRFTEGYVKSIGKNISNGNLNSHKYFVVGNKYLKPASVIGFQTILGLLLLAVALIYLLGLCRNKATFIKYILLDKRYIMSMFLLALYSAVVWQLPRIAVIAKIPFSVIILMCFIITVFGVTCVIKKRYAYFKNKLSSREFVEYQKLFLELLFICLLVCMTLITNIYISILTFLIPFIMIKGITNKNIIHKISASILFCIWSVTQFFILFAFVGIYITNLFSINFFMIIFINMTVWLFLLVYCIVFHVKNIYNYNKSSGLKI